MKTCKRCGDSKGRGEFRPDPRYKDGLGSWCKECHRTRNSEWAKENRERLTKKAAAWRLSNRETSRATNRKFKAGNKDRLAKDHAEWARLNRDKRNATAAKHKAARLKATPSWADLSEIAAVYKAAADARLTVDHIVPLQHPLVCGLHVHWNLQVIPGRENSAKKNYWWPDMAATKEPRLPLPEPKMKQGAML